MARAIRSSTLPRLFRARCSTRWTASRRRSPARHSRSARRNCRSGRRSSTGSAPDGGGTKKRTESVKELAGKPPAELKTEIGELLKEQFGLRMQKATQQLTNTEKLRQVRRS